MKKVITCLLLSFIFISCSNSADDKKKANEVDTSIIGSDNPNPVPDTTGMNNKPDTSKK